MKGQLISFDFVAAFFVFLGIFIGLTVSWNGITESIEDISVRNDMEKTALIASDVLVRSKGQPTDWDSTNVLIFGLSSGSPNVLSGDKILEMKEVPYAAGKEILGSPYDFFVEFNTTPSGTLVLNGSAAAYGNPPAGNNTIIMKRFVIVDGTVAVMTMKVWA